MSAIQITHGDAANIRFTLEENQIASTSEARGLALECVKGSVWITFEGLREDYVLNPGERMPIVSRGRLVVQGLVPSEVKFVAPAKPAEISRTHATSRNAIHPGECLRTMVTRLSAAHLNIDNPI